MASFTYKAIDHNGETEKTEVVELVWQSTPTKLEGESYWEGL